MTAFNHYAQQTNQPYSQGFYGNQPNPYTYAHNIGAVQGYQPMNVNPYGLGYQPTNVNPYGAGYQPTNVNPYGTGYQPTNANPFDTPGSFQQPANHPFNVWDRPENLNTIKGKAAWTKGGTPTKCRIPWSYNKYMTVAVSSKSPYKCGQVLKIENLNTGDEIFGIVVDEVVDYPANKINLHKRAFQALGADPEVGIIDVNVTPMT